MSFPTPTDDALPTPPQHSLRRRLVGTLLLALLQVLWLCGLGPEPGLLSVACILFGVGGALSFWQ